MTDEKQVQQLNAPTAERHDLEKSEAEAQEPQPFAAATPEDSNDSDNDTKSLSQPKRFAAFRRTYAAVTYTPKRCRWDPDDPPGFSIWMNLLFGFAGAFTVANLYYSHPILNILATDFGVSYEQVSQIPTLAQAGYAVGLALLCPLGDLFKRRPFVLDLVFFTATLS